MRSRPQEHAACPDLDLVGTVGELARLEDGAAALDLDVLRHIAAVEGPAGVCEGLGVAGNRQLERCELSAAEQGAVAGALGREARPGRGCDERGHDEARCREQCSGNREGRPTTAAGAAPRRAPPRPQERRARPARPAGRPRPPRAGGSRVRAPGPRDRAARQARRPAVYSDRAPARRGLRRSARPSSSRLPPPGAARPRRQAGRRRPPLREGSRRRRSRPGCAPSGEARRPAPG